MWISLNFLEINKANFFKIKIMSVACTGFCYPLTIFATPLEQKSILV